MRRFYQCPDSVIHSQRSVLQNVTYQWTWYLSIEMTSVIFKKGTNSFHMTSIWISARLPLITEIVLRGLWCLICLIITNQDWRNENRTEAIKLSYPKLISIHKDSFFRLSHIYNIWKVINCWTWYIYFIQ